MPKRKRSGLTRDITVYTCAVWYRDNDPHSSIVATTARKARAAAVRAMRDSARMYAGSTDDPCTYCERGKSGDHIACLMDAQAWSGVHAESLRKVYQYQTWPRNRRELKDDLRASGVAYPESA